MVSDRRTAKSERWRSTHCASGLVLLLAAAVGLSGLPSGFGQQMVGGVETGSLGEDVLVGRPPNVNGIPPTNTVYTNAYQEKARCRSPKLAATGQRPGFGSLTGPRGPYQTLPLVSDQPVSEGLSSGVYLSSVGGIAFDQVAKPQGRLAVKSLELKYDPGRPDGSRLGVVLNGRACTTQGLPDWQLLPIACFADSPYFGVVTLFGELPEGEARPAGTKYVVSYHPAFEGTLLGLRLFQGDIMLLDPNTTGELPRFAGGYHLGVGEQPPNPRTWQRASAALNQVLAGGERFVSYLICDAASAPTFSMQGHPRTRGRQLGLQGTVYFCFWKRGPDQIEEFSRPGQTIRYQSFRPQHLNALSNTLSSQTALLEQANPAVYRSMANTMAYAAFFRHAKQHDAQMWEEFLASLTAIPGTEFAATTPTLVQSVTGHGR